MESNHVAHSAAGLALPPEVHLLTPLYWRAEESNLIILRGLTRQLARYSPVNTIPPWRAPDNRVNLIALMSQTGRATGFELVSLQGVSTDKSADGRRRILTFNLSLNRRVLSRLSYPSITPDFPLRLG